MDRSQGNTLEAKRWLEESGLNADESEVLLLENFLESSSSWTLRDEFLEQLGTLLDRFPELRAGLGKLLRFVLGSRSPNAFLAFVEKDRDALPVLLRMLSLPAPSTEWLVQDPDCFDWLRLTAGQAVSADHLRDVLLAELSSLDEESRWLDSMLRFRRRETLRLIYAFCLHDMPWYDVGQQLSIVADACIAGAIEVTKLSMRSRRAALPDPLQQLTVLGVGALGANDLFLDTTLALLFLTEPSNASEEVPANEDDVNRFVESVTHWLSHPEGFGYSVIQPRCALPDAEGGRSSVVQAKKWLQEIENRGRIEDRIDLLSARFVGGNYGLATYAMDELTSFIFQKYVTGNDIAELGAVYRKWTRYSPSMDQLSRADGWGIDRLEAWKKELDFLVRYLQLLNGSEDPEIREPNILSAIDALARKGYLSEAEKGVLNTACNRFASTILRWQMHTCSIPIASDTEAVLSGSDQIGLSIDGKRQHPYFVDGSSMAKIDFSLESTRSPLLESIQRIRQIAHHLQGDVFSDVAKVPEETDLVLDPSPDPEWVETILERHRFRRTHAAFQYLRELAREEVRMLSSQRCRYFLAAIAPRLLQKIGSTPNPDSTLENLAKTCRSLGGKGILWELFNVHEPSMDLYVRMCGTSPYLVSLLINSPGMIDELLDSLMVNRLPTEPQIETMLHELCRGAEDIEPILSSFKSVMHLNVGVRDILGKESIADTHRALSDIAEGCIRQVIEFCYQTLVRKLGIPKISNELICRFAIVALGKYGAREPNYHSDLTLLCLYEAEGETTSIGFSRIHQSVSNSEFFHQLTQKCLQMLNRVGRNGRLYETSIWNPSEDRTYHLAWSVASLVETIDQQSISPKKRLEYCSHRMIYGEPAFQIEADRMVTQAILQKGWNSQDTIRICSERSKLEETATSRNLKRGPGGTVDIEWLCQMLTLQQSIAENHPLIPGTLDALSRFAANQTLLPEEAVFLSQSYNFLRSVESGLRLMNTKARHELPADSSHLEQLAYILHLKNGAELDGKCIDYLTRNREIFRKYVHE
jgi:glutamate-ammonia-ligase adenylyltransferase